MTQDDGVHTGAWKPCVPCGIGGLGIENGWADSPKSISLGVLYAGYVVFGLERTN